MGKKQKGRTTEKKKKNKRVGRQPDTGETHDNNQGGKRNKGRKYTYNAREDKTIKVKQEMNTQLQAQTLTERDIRQNLFSMCFTAVILFLNQEWYSTRYG